jgi:hypothetical protein
MERRICRCGGIQLPRKRIAGNDTRKSSKGGQIFRTQTQQAKIMESIGTTISPRRLINSRVVLHLAQSGSAGICPGFEPQNMEKAAI